MGSTEFGEGAEVIENKVVQLTWKSRKVFIRNRDTLELEKTLTLPSEIAEGWGITYDSSKKEAYISDGSSNVYVTEFTSDFNSMSVINTISTKYTKINELEFVKSNLILANRY